MGGAAFYGNTDNWGRSYHNGSPGNPVADIIHGYNFQEQWDYALKQDVPFVYVTGWNEWVAGKFPSHDDNQEHSCFCDQDSPEYIDRKSTRMKSSSKCASCNASSD